MSSQKRRFQREVLNAQCLFESGAQIDQAQIINYSRMGALVQTQTLQIQKKYIFIVYQNEKNQLIRMLCAIKHITEKNGSFLYGLQFIGIEKRE